MGKWPTNDHKVETRKEPKQQRVETLVRILIQTKNKHFDEKCPLQTENLNTRASIWEEKGEPRRGNQLLQNYPAQIIFFRDFALNWKSWWRRQHPKAKSFKLTASITDFFSFLNMRELVLNKCSRDLNPNTLSAAFKPYKVPNYWTKRWLKPDLERKLICIFLLSRNYLH